MKSFVAGLLIGSILLSGCVKDRPVLNTSAALTPGLSGKVLIGNEGNFGSGNASLSVYDPNTGVCVEDQYKGQNGSVMGDVLQSIYAHKDKYFLVLNNSSKILVCDQNLKLQSVIQGLTSPRYFLPLSNQKAYVSDLKANALAVLDLNSLQKTGSIALPGWSEAMLQVYNKVFVCNMQRSYVYIINALNDTKTDSVWVGPNASSLQLDKYDKLWILSGGDSLAGLKPRLTRYNVYQGQVEQSVELPGGYGASHLCVNASRDTLYYLQRHVYHLSVDQATISVKVAIQSGARNFYSMAVHPLQNRVYVADALDYVQRSVIYVYSTSGEEKTQFKAGVNSGSFYFE
jgi:hypothetical protein